MPEQRCRRADRPGNGKICQTKYYATGASSSAQEGAIYLVDVNGDGTFKTSQLYYTGQAASNAAVADFNGDGMPDVVLLNDGGFTASFLSFMLNATKPVSVSPLSMNFGTVAVGSKKAGTVIVTNNQSSALAITSVTLAGADPSDFPAKSACKSSLKAGWDCTITVTFTATATGALSATLNIKDAVGTQAVQLSGTGK